MARVFFYRYFEEAPLYDQPEKQADDSSPLPAKGDTVTRRGRAWKVHSVACSKTFLPKLFHQTPLEVHITLVPADR